MSVTNTSTFSLLEGVDMGFWASVWSGRLGYCSTEGIFFSCYGWWWWWCGGAEGIGGMGRHIHRRPGLHSSQTTLHQGWSIVFYHSDLLVMVWFVFIVLTLDVLGFLRWLLSLIIVVPPYLSLCIYYLPKRHMMSNFIYCFVSFRIHHSFNDIFPSPRFSPFFYSPANKPTCFRSSLCLSFLLPIQKRISEQPCSNGEP